MLRADCTKCSKPVDPHVRGFTLLELLVVIVIIAILVALALPTFNNNGFETEIVAAKQSVRAIQLKVDEHYHRFGKWPSNIDRHWFRGGKVPKNPWRPDFNGRASNHYGDASTLHPWEKRVEIHRNPFYYNNINGIVRIRVPEQKSDEETVALYNEVNTSAITHIRRLN